MADSTNPQNNFGAVTIDELLVKYKVDVFMKNFSTTPKEDVMAMLVISVSQIAHENSLLVAVRRMLSDLRKSEKKDTVVFVGEIAMLTGELSVEKSRTSEMATKIEQQEAEIARLKKELFTERCTLQKFASALNSETNEHHKKDAMLREIESIIKK